MKYKTYTGGNLYGIWLATYKIDGIRAVVKDGSVLSRDGKPLYNLDFLAGNEGHEYEIFLGNWEDTMTAVRSKSPQKIPEGAVFQLFPNLSPHLIIGEWDSPEEYFIKEWLMVVNSYGYEGLVLHGPEYCLKVKPKITYDVPIDDLIPGKNQFAGMLGSFKTIMGKVGTGLTKKQRMEYNNPTMIGQIIEVEARSLTPKGNFRHPRFVRVRWDKGNGTGK